MASLHIARIWGYTNAIVHQALRDAPGVSVMWSLGSQHCVSSYDSAVLGRFLTRLRELAAPITPEQRAANRHRALEHFRELKYDAEKAGDLLLAQSYAQTLATIAGMSDEGFDAYYATFPGGV